jgi:hypothetical protein
MPTIASMLDRISLLLQDSNHSAWLADHKLTQLKEEIAQLGRQELCGQIAWRHGETGVAQYGFDDTTVAFAEVLYDGRSLRHVTEDSLSRYRRDWERHSGTPSMWTEQLQSPQTVRIVPQPVLTGNAIPQIPGVPLMQREAHNVIAFLWEMPQTDNQLLALPDALEDLLVWRTVSALCRQVGEYQDLQKGAAFQELATMALDALLGG